MTQQYIVGEFSSLLAELRPAPSEPLSSALDNLRQAVEAGPPARLPGLAREAMTLTDDICWAALEAGDPGSFRRFANGAAMLQEFTVNANLLS